MWSYFTDEDLSPTAMGVRSPNLKVVNFPQRQKHVKDLWKTTNESEEYCYPELTREEQRVRNMKIAPAWGVVEVGGSFGLWRLAMCVRLGSMWPKEGVSGKRPARNPPCHHNNSNNNRKRKEKRLRRITYPFFFFFLYYISVRSLRSSMTSMPRRTHQCISLHPPFLFFF